MKISVAMTMLLGLALPLVSTPVAYAQQEKWTHYGVRPLAMGNAFVAVADDYNALFYNPAGLARLPEWTGELINPYFELSNSTRDFLSDIQSLQGGSAGNTQDVLHLIEEQSGKVHHVAAGFTPHLVFRGFGLGIGADLSGTLLFHRYPTIDIDLGPSIIVPIAFAFNMLEDRLSLGFTVKARIEGGIDKEFSIEDIEAFSKKETEEGETDTESAKLTDYVEGGRGFGADFGLLFTPIKPMEPTIGISITDIGGTTYKKMNIGGEAAGTPSTTLPSVNTGFSIKPFQTPSQYWLMAIDAHAINQPYSFSKKLNLGTEYGVGRILKLQMGLHQGYLSGGFQFDVRLLKLRFVTYAEEMGTSAGTLQDRRYAVQLKLLI